MFPIDPTKMNIWDAIAIDAATQYMRRMRGEDKAEREAERARRVRDEIARAETERRRAADMEKRRLEYEARQAARAAYEARPDVRRARMRRKITFMLFVLGTFAFASVGFAVTLILGLVRLP